MRNGFLLVFFTLFSANLFSQAPPVDSLKKLLATAQEDSVKVNALRLLSFYNQNFQQGLDLAKEALQLARKINFKKGEADALHQIGNQYETVSNFPRALFYFLEALKIREDLNNVNDVATSTESIGFIYYEQGDYEKALAYYQKADALFSPDMLYRKANLNTDMGVLYQAAGKRDSALIRFQAAYEYFLKSNDQYQLDLALNGLGDIQQSLGNRELALGYYRQAEKNAISYDDTLGLSYVYLDIANYYVEEKQKDSAILYAQKSLLNALGANVLENIVKSGKLLSNLHKGQDDKKAVEYLEIVQSASDSLNSRQRLMDLQNMSFSESLRQAELTEKEKKEADERRQNLQYALITLGIIIFITVFLFLSRTIIVNERWISFFAILGLLVVLEFINLLIHPWLAHFTGESPVFMLLALVIIASLLIPLHHRLEHWIKGKLIEKNKAIRLAAARKIINKLENNN